jgi:multisubunit Na+/H+ antiporter MnhB subunit
MKPTRWIIALGAVFILVTPVLYYQEVRAADRCLDAGGSYDYAGGDCDHETNHPVLPWARRNRGWMMLSGVGLGMVLIGAATSRTRPRDGA